MEAHPRTAEEGGGETQTFGHFGPRSAAVGVGVLTPLQASPLSAPIPAEFKKKRVLLVDTSHSKRELRAEVMRKLGMDVDCAADIAEARSWWRAALYDLVLINMEKEWGHRDKFCDDVRSATPRQRLAFLVGQPKYLADSPNADEEMPVQNADGQAVPGVDDALSTDRRDLTQRWGILEASRRISAVRSALIARARAMRALPAPPRDSEGRRSKATATLTSLDDLLREESR
jgi:CheY-like chemotaxis protein